MRDQLEQSKLLLQSSKPLEIQPSEKNHVKQLFIPGEGEIVVRFNNFKREKKYFAFLVEETDVEGIPLHRETLVTSSLKKGNPTKINAAYNEVIELLGTVELETGKEEFVLAMTAKLDELKALVSK